MTNTNVEDNLKLVGYTIKKYIKLYPKDELDDINQSGYVGLIKANKTYNPNLGFSWSSYAIRCILNEIMMYKRKENKHLALISLDEIVKDTKDENITYKDCLVSDKDSIEDKLFECDFKRKLNKILSKMSDRDRNIIILYLFRGYKQIEIEEKFDISQSAISRIVKKFKNNLKKNLQK